MANAYITIDDDPDYWGDCDGFDQVAEGDRIAQAAEASGVRVLRNKAGQWSTIDVDPNDEIDWFGPWCAGGQSWSDEQWAEWFKAYFTAETAPGYSMRIKSAVNMIGVPIVLCEVLEGNEVICECQSQEHAEKIVKAMQVYSLYRADLLI